MPAGTPFPDWRRAQLERAAAGGDRVCAYMLKHDLYFPEALAGLVAELRRPAPDNLVSLAERRASLGPL